MKVVLIQSDSEEDLKNSQLMAEIQAELEKEVSSKKKKPKSIEDYFNPKMSIWEL